MHPVLVKLGGAVITDKSRPEHLQKATANRLVNEIRKAGAPTVLMHGAGSFGHPHVKDYQIGVGPMTSAKMDGVAKTMAAVAKLHAEILGLAADAGLRPVSIPLHLDMRLEESVLDGLPIDDIMDLLEAGYTPVLHGTLVRDEAVGWKVVSADALMASLAEELEPRLAVFVSDVDGVLDEAGNLRATVSSENGISHSTSGADVTGGMQGKVVHGLAVAESCPTIILNGNERGRLEDALKGRDVPCTHLVA